MGRHAARFHFNFMTADQKSTIELSVIYSVFICPIYSPTALYNYFILLFSQTSNTFSPILSLGLIFLPISLRQLKRSQVLLILIYHLPACCPYTLLSPLLLRMSYLCSHKKPVSGLCFQYSLIFIQGYTSSSCPFSHILFSLCLSNK